MPTLNSNETMQSCHKLPPFKFVEQENYLDREEITDEDKEFFKTLDFDAEKDDPPKFLGLSADWTKYYIGATWLTNDRALVVTPKQIAYDESQETDFIAMFLAALKFAPSSEYFSKFYGINFDEPQIETESLDEQLTPLLIVHYVWTLKKLISKGLKKNYIIREENLKSKVRGRIMLQKNLQKNIFTQRLDRVYCKFQEYSVDISENKLLKKALMFSQNYLNKFASDKNAFTEIVEHINNIKPAFSQVSDEIEVHEIKSIRKNKLFKEYTETLRLAKMILQRFDYSMTKSKSDLKSVPPFWIDMSRLYEVYVYSKLHAAYGDTVRFQVKGECNSVVDFIKIDEQLIMDTKYKNYKKQSSNDLLNDIRQLSGYARDEKILESLNLHTEEKIVQCVIIYPELESSSIENETIFESSVPILELVQGHKIPGFRNFYRLCVKLPRK